MNITRRSFHGGAGLLAFAFLAATPASYAASITSLPQLGANDVVDWNVSPGANNTNSFVATTSGGLAVTISEANSSFVNTSQGAWFGNFPAGTKVIYDQGPTGPVKFTFASAVQGFGLYVDNGVCCAFTATIAEYSGATLLGSYSSSYPASQLVFLGVRDATSDITSVTISTALSGIDSLAFSNLNLLDSTSPANTPEPGTTGLVLMGLLVLIGRGWFPFTGRDNRAL